jgi:hypothetical protein
MNLPAGREGDSPLHPRFTSLTMVVARRSRLLAQLDTLLDGHPEDVPPSIRADIGRFQIWALQKQIDRLCVAGDQCDVHIEELIWVV